MALTEPGTREAPPAAVRVNWVLALLALLGAAAAVILQYVQILGSAGCSDQTCHLGPGPVGFTLIQYGVPAVAVLGVAVSAFTAKRRWGILVPVFVWAVVAIAVVVLLFTFRH